MHDMTPRQQAQWAEGAMNTLEAVARFFRARAHMYAALHGYSYEESRLPPLAQDVEALLKRFKDVDEPEEKEDTSVAV